MLGCFPDPLGDALGPWDIIRRWLDDLSPSRGALFQLRAHNSMSRITLPAAGSSNRAETSPAMRKEERNNEAFIIFSFK